MHTVACLATIGTALCSLLPPVGIAQVPSPSQVQQALQQPGLADSLRARLRASGLTTEQVRARLRAAGYPESLLDQYLGAGATGVAPAPLELAAYQALGLPPIALAHGLLPVDTGMIAARALVPRSRVFGVDVFRRTGTQFLPLLSGPVPPDYRLGPGDVLVLILTGDVELAYTLQVMREGFVVIPQVGQVHVANLTLDQVRDVLYTRLGRVYSGVRRTASATTRFDVSVANVRANQVYVVGEVAQPGAYQISSLGTSLTALYAAGGVTENGNQRRVTVRRGDAVIATLDLYDYLLRGDTRHDVRIETGDIVFVPVRGVRAEVTGAVRRPAIYELKPGESLGDLLAAAGGFRADAALKRLAIHRILAAADRGPGAPPRTAIDVALQPASPSPPAEGSREHGAVPSPSPPTPPGSREQGAVPSGPNTIDGVVLPAFSLQDGDSVVVDSILPLGGQPYVAIAGMVEKPGTYPWRAGMTMRDLVLLARGPRVGADLREAEIARLPADRSQGQLATTVRVPLDSTYLFERDSLGRYVGAAGLPFPAAGTAAEVPLEPYDNVLILRQPNFEFQRTVTITGQVRYPGFYALRSKDDRLASLVARAGGLTPQAYPEGIRFFRVLNDAGRINLKLKDALRDSTSRDNIILQPGDSMHVPEFIPSVRVTGAVNAPGSVLWKRGASASYYVSAAGGFARLADEGATSVRFANGEVRTRSKFLLFTSWPNPDPGGEVFVPAKEPSERRDWTGVLAATAALASVMASLVAIVVAVQ